MQLGAIPVDLNVRCIMVEEIGDRHHNSMRPLKWKCTNECRLLTNIRYIGDKGAISKMHRRCSSWAGQVHVHYDSILQSDLRFSEWCGGTLFTLSSQHAPAATRTPPPPLTCTYMYH